MKRLVILAAAGLLLVACGGSGVSPTTPTAPSKPTAAVAITTFTVQSSTNTTAGLESVERIIVTATPQPQAAATSGYKYTVNITLRESGGVVATISAADLTFSNASGTIGATHFDNPLVTAANNKVPANGTADTKSLTSTDSDGSKGAATKVSVSLTGFDDNQHSLTVTGTADVPRILDLPVIKSFTASPSSISPGESSSLKWSVSNATSITIDHGIGTVSTTGSKTVSPISTTTYTMTATNGDGSSTKSTTVSLSYPDVEYRVSGYRASSITYANASEGTSQVADVLLPWSYTFSGAHAGQFLYVSVQNDMPSGCVTADIYKRGTLYKTSQSCGAYVIATASGSY